MIVGNSVERLELVGCTSSSLPIAACSEAAASSASKSVSDGETDLGVEDASGGPTGCWPSLGVGASPSSSLSALFQWSCQSPICN